MPVQFSNIETTEIIGELRRRGYGIDSCHGYAFRLAVRSKTVLRKSDGLGIFEPIGGVTVRQLREIQRTSTDAAHAASRVEALAKGEVQTVEETDRSTGGPSLASVLHVVDSRIDEKLEPVMSALTQLISLVGGGQVKAAFEQQAQIPPEPATRDEFSDFTEEDLAELPPPPPKPPRRRRQPAAVSQSQPPADQPPASE